MLDEHFANFGGVFGSLYASGEISLSGRIDFMGVVKKAAAKVGIFNLIISWLAHFRVISARRIRAANIFDLAVERVGFAAQ